MKKNEKPVHFRDDQTAVENLPFPIVLYPTHYGTFICYKQDEKSDAVYCICSAEAIENYVLFNLNNLNRGSNADPTRNFILDSFDFPRVSVRELMNKNVPQDMTILDHIKFERKLCHECNKAIPSYRYCHEMYGTTFIQTYGWYVNKKFWEYAINPMTYEFIEEKCPQEIIDVYGNEYYELLKKKQNFIDEKDFFAANEISGEIQHIGKNVRKLIENEVREKFGHKKIGESWTSETILYYIIKRLFPKNTIKRHYRPGFLGKLELDIFIEELNLGIEYQGVQHFKPVKHWGGEKSLEITKNRDKKKKLLCKKHGVKLLFFYYYNGLSEEYVQNEVYKVLRS